MKKRFHTRILLAAALSAAFATADLSALTVVDSNYGVASHHNAGSGEIISYDWSPSGDLYTMIASNYAFGGVYRVSNGVTSQIVAGSATEYPGGSVISAGGFIYFNTSDFSNTQKIFRLNPETESVSQISTTPNFGLHAYQGGLFITGAVGWGATHIYHTPLDGNGDLVNNPAIDLGEVSAFAGPLTFDASGNLYYASGYGDLSIYRWSAGEVAAALSDPLANPLSTTDHLWLDYSDIFGDAGGATSMILDANGDLLLTLTGFGVPSVLARFGVDDTGLYDGFAGSILESDERLGELRFHNGQLYVADGSQIYEVIPEPSSFLLLVAGLGGIAFFRRRRAVKLGLLAIAVSGACVHAGPYSGAWNDPGDPNPYDAPIPGFVGAEGDGIVGGSNTVNPIFVGWASRVVSYLPAPGVSAGYAIASTALGPVTGDLFNAASLGDLYNPATPPKVGGVPVDPNVTDDAYGFIGHDAPGSITLGFNLAITNGVGADFAIFENGIVSLYTTPDGSVAGKTFAELAYVEVSTDGINFARFPSVSLTENPVGGYGTIDPTDLYNLAGKHPNGEGESWGTPFDLDDLADHLLVTSGLLDLSNINYVRVVDIPGNGMFQDSLGNPIYDSWVTFASGGFDLEAIGVIHQVPEPSSVLLTASLLGGFFLIRKRGLSGC